MPQRSTCTLLLTFAVLGNVFSVPFVEHVYHNYTALVDIMNDLAESYPQYTEVYSVGKSVEDRELLVMAIAGTDPDKHIPGRPEVKYVGNMHGNEAVGRELLLQLIEHYLVGYTDGDADIKQFLDETRVHILPSMNPDGFEESDMLDCTSIKGRFNANGLNLNRNFPDFFEENTAEIQIETQAIMDWLEDVPFILSANLHGGALLANYPYDNIEPDKKNASYCPYHASPDDDTYRNLSLTYSLNHENMYDEDFNDCEHVRGGNRPGFKDGITNGCAWYQAIGVMQDYNYIAAGCMEITLEVSCCKYPNVTELPTFWDWNRKSLIEYLKQVHKGVKGQVLDENDDPIVGASVRVQGRDLPFKTASDGYYWRILLPGTYTIEVAKEGYQNAQKSVAVSGALYDVSLLNFKLEPITTSTQSNDPSDDGVAVSPSICLSVILTSLIILVRKVIP